YMDMLTNAGYGVGRGSASAATFETDALDTTQPLTDATTQGALQGWIKNDAQLGGLQPDDNRLYVVFVEPGVVVQDPTGQSSGNGAGTLLAYHSSFAGQDAFNNNINIHYAVV